MCEQSLNDYITEQCALIDAALDRLLPAENESPETIHKAMRFPWENADCGRIDGKIL